MHKIVFLILWVAAITAGMAVPAYASISHRIEVIDNRFIINADGLRIDPVGADALLVHNGNFVHGYYVTFIDSIAMVSPSMFENVLGININAAYDQKVELRYNAEGNGFSVHFNDNIFRLFQKYDNTGERTSIPVIAIEEVRPHVTAITGEQAVDIVRRAVNSAFRLHFRFPEDRTLFLDEIAYREVDRAMGRFYRVEINFFDQWAKRFISFAYVNVYTRQLYVGDYFFGLTNRDIQYYLTQRYQNALPTENKPVRLIPFSDINKVEGYAFVYVNFPEQISGNALVETYFNHVDSLPKGGRIFTSHLNITGQSIDYIIRFKNNNDEEATLRLFTDLVIHHDDQYQDQTVQEHLLRLYKMKMDNPREIVLGPGQQHEDILRVIENDRFFTGIIDFETIGCISVTVFAVPSDVGGSIPTPTQMYYFNFVPQTFTAAPPDVENNYRYYTTYSGIGISYRLNAKLELRASEMEHWNIAFETGGAFNNINERNGLREIVEIKLTTPRGVNNEITTATWWGNVMSEGPRTETDRYERDLLSNYGNLGNWGVEYTITATLINDTAYAKIFRCDIVPEHQATWLFMQGDFMGVANVNNREHINSFRRRQFDNYDQVHIGSGIRGETAVWVMVPPHTTKEVTYVYVLGTETHSTVFHVWSST